MAAGNIAAADAVDVAARQSPASSLCFGQSENERSKVIWDSFRYLQRFQPSLPAVEGAVNNARCEA